MIRIFFDHCGDDNGRNWVVETDTQRWEFHHRQDAERALREEQSGSAGLTKAEIDALVAMEEAAL